MVSGRAHIPDIRVIETEASAWLAQLDGDDMSAQDLAVFQEWMQRSPVHQNTIRELADLWGDLNILTDLMEPIREAHAGEKRLMAARPWFTGNLNPVMAVLLAAVVVTFGVLQMGAFGKQNAYPQMLVTQIGEQVVTDLADGSTVSLNTNSSVEVDFSPDMRKIRLLKGEAIFDVVSDKDRPFVVYAGDGVVRAVGTIFSVQLDEDVISVAVTEGAVELTSVDQVVSAPVDVDTSPAVGYVKSGHKAVLVGKQASIVPVAVEELETDLSWKDGVLTFRGEALSEAIAEFSRYTNLSIKIDPEIRDFRIGGIFPVRDVDLFLSTLETENGIRVERPEPDMVILSLDKSL